MSRAWRAGAVALLMLVAACTDPARTPLEPQSEHPATEGLDFLFPAFHRALLVSSGGEPTEGAPAGGPARVVSEGEEPPQGEGDFSTAVAAIYNPRTRVWIDGGGAVAHGEHDYQGNKGRIETRLSVAFEGAPVGSQLGITENSWSFILDFGVVKHIDAFARIFGEYKCGLSAWGSSDHSAWWEAVAGGSPSTFSRVVRTSQSDVARMADCTDEAPIISTGGGGEGGGAGYQCWVSIWYDLHTGEILDVDVLWCEEIGG